MITALSGLWGTDQLRAEALRNPLISGGGDPKMSAGRGITTFTYTTALPYEAGVTRRDPSDVIRCNGLYYLWYTKVSADGNAGYPGDIFCATSEDGHRFTERGLAIGKGSKGKWDGHGVFTPNILIWKQKYFLYYTAVSNPFDPLNSPTAIGMAEADSPDGPWKKFKGNPVLKADTAHPKAFDSMRVDDSDFVVRGNKIMFYYKGRCILDGPQGWRNTHMGVAIAADPSGPFVKNPANPLLRGHEVLVWPQGHGVGTMVTNLGRKGIYYAADGLHFKWSNRIANGPAAPGIYRADNFKPNLNAPMPQWGISMGFKNHEVYLKRFDIHYHDEQNR